MPWVIQRRFSGDEVFILNGISYPARKDAVQAVLQTLSDSSASRFVKTALETGSSAAWHADLGLFKLSEIDVPPNENERALFGS